MKTKGWENRLITYLQGVSRKEFDYGQIDCALFAAGAVEAMTGKDWTMNKRGQYRTLVEGKRLLKAEGFKDHIDYVAKNFEQWESVLLAQRGDLVVMPADAAGLALGIVQGPNVYIMTPNGLALLPITEAIKAFKV